VSMAKDASELPKEQRLAGIKTAQPIAVKDALVRRFDAGWQTHEPTEQEKILGAIEGAACCGTKLAALSLPERGSIVGEWFREADYGLIFGLRGLGKSWFGLGLASAIASQGAFGPWVSRVAWPVLYVDGEMVLKVVRERIIALCGACPDSLHLLSHEALFEQGGATLNLARHGHQAALSEYVISHGVRVMILDNLSCLSAGLKENDADSWEPVKHWLLALRRQRIAVVLIHHSGRSGKDLRGTTKREDDASWIIRLEEPADDSETLGARFLSRFTKNRNAATEPPAYDWTVEPHHDGTVQVRAVETSSDDVLVQWVRDGLSSASDIAFEMGISKGMVSRRACALIRAGRLAKEGRDYIIPASGKTQ